MATQSVRFTNILLKSVPALDQLQLRTNDVKSELALNWPSVVRVYVCLYVRYNIICRVISGVHKSLV